MLEEEEELARPNSPSFNARTRFDDVDARRIISYLFSFVLSQMCVRGVVLRASWEWYKLTSPSMRNRTAPKSVPKKEQKIVLFRAVGGKNEKISSEERATSPLSGGVRGQFWSIFWPRSHLFFVFVF